MQKSLLYEFILNDMENKKLFYDSKTILQEIVQSVMIKDSLSYHLVGEEGPDHDKTFVSSRLCIGDRGIWKQVTDRTKKSCRAGGSLPGDPYAERRTGK